MHDEYRIIKKKYLPNAINILKTKAMKNSVSQHSMKYNFMKKNWKCFFYVGLIKYLTRHTLI